MTSVYGAGPYGVGYYSRVYTFFSGSAALLLAASGDFRNPVERFGGDTSIGVTLSGDVRNAVDRFAGTIALVTALSGGFRNAVDRFSGQTSLYVDMSGNLNVHEVHALSGTVALLIGLSGKLSGTFQFTGSAGVTFDINQATINRERSLSATLDDLDISLNSSGIYIGSLWEPGQSQGDDWEESEGIPNPWTPASVSGGGWTESVAPSNPWNATGVPSVNWKN